jgi:uncharacterized protein (TIGR03437 family)
MPIDPSRYFRAAGFLAVASYIASVAGAANAPRPNHTLSDLPLGFERNAGQFDARVRFASRAPGLGIYLTGEEAVVTLALPNPPGKSPATGRPKTGPSQVAAARFHLEGASHRFQPEALDPLPGATNYLIGSDRAKWLTGIARYQRVLYRDVYPGIDMLYHGDGRALEYDFNLAPGADAARISVSYEGVKELRKNEGGDLVLVMDGTAILQRRPVAYQVKNGNRVPVRAEYRVETAAKRVSFILGPYDHKHALVIDPVLTYGTYLGGTGFDGVNSMAVDSAGNAYVTGITNSPDLPASASGPQAVLRGGTDAFIAKLNPAGTALVYLTYLGGSGNDQGTSIVVDSSGIAYLCGIAGAADFPAVGQLSTSIPNRYNGGTSDGFVAALNATGTGLVFSIFIGGPADDIANALTRDSSGALYVAGYTHSPTFTGIQSHSAQAANAGGYDVFVLALAGTGSLNWATYFGGTGDDIAYSIAVDPSTGVYVAGGSTGALPLATSHKGSGQDAFLLQMTAAGSFLAVKDLGGSSDQAALDVVVDASGIAYLTGYTNSADFLVQGPALQAQNHGGYDGFVTILNNPYSSGAVPVFSTYLGGKGTDAGYAITFDTKGDIYVAGYTDSPDFLPGAPIQPASGPNTFVIEFSLVYTSNLANAQASPTQAGVIFASYLGAFDVNNPVSLGLRIASTGDEIFVAGYANSSFYFPSSASPPLYRYGGGSSDGFIAHYGNVDVAVALGSIGPYLGTSVPGTSNIIPGSDLLIPLTISNNGPNPATSVVATLGLPKGVTFIQCLAGAQCVLSGNTVVITLPSLLAGTSIQFQIVAKTSLSLNNQDVQFSAQVSSLNPDRNGGNNFQTESASIVGSPPFTLSIVDQIDFGTVTVGKSVQQNIVITAGTDDVNFHQLSSPAVPQFKLLGDPAANTQTLPKGQSRTITVAFTPDSSGQFTGSLNIFASNPNNTNAVGDTIILKGQGAQPALSISGVFNAIGPQAGIVPGSFFAIFGSNFTTIAQDDWSKLISNGQLPIQLDGVGVTVGGKPAYINAITPTQINAQAPDIAVGNVQVTVTNASGASATFSTTAQLAAPALIPWPANQPGATRQTCSGGADCWAVKNGSFAQSTVPAKPGEVLSLWGTGFGPTNPAVPAGQEPGAKAGSPTQGTVTATLNGAAMPVFGAAISQYAGEYQVNVQVPLSLANGDYPLKLTVNGVDSPTYTLTVRQ